MKPSLPLPVVRPTRDQLKPGESLCDHCTGKCCRYFSTPIETPSTWDEYDAIRWYLAHDLTLIYVSEDAWYLLVSTKCQYLLDDYRCAIYHDRPKICREYKTKDCEYEDDWAFDKVFETPEQIWEYAEVLLPPQRKPAVKPSPVSSPSPAAGLLPIVTLPS